MNKSGFRELVVGAKVPLIANGDMYTQDAISQMLKESHCSGVMLGRPVLLNASILIKSGKTLSQMTVLRDFLTECIRFMPVYQVVKYTLMEMMVARRHTPSILEKLKTSDIGIEYGRVDPHYDSISAARSVRDICAIFSMEADYDQAAKDRIKTNSTTLKNTSHKNIFQDRILETNSSVLNNNSNIIASHDTSEVIVSAVITECGKRKDRDAEEEPAHR